MAYIGGLLALLLGTSATVSASAAPVFDVRFVILKTPAQPGEFKVSGDKLTYIGNAALLTGAFDVNWGGESLRSDGRQVLLNGKALALVPPRPDATVPASVRVLSSPRVQQIAGGNAVVQFGSAESIQYFARDPDGRFSLKTIRQTPEIQLEITLDEELAGDEMGLKLAYRFVILGKRAPVEGVALDVGAPAVREDSGAGRLRARLGEWCLLAPKGQSDLGLAALLRVTRQP